MIFPELADKILTEVRRLIDEDFIVVDTEGIIIASTDPTRIGSFHEGAKIAAKERRKLIITEQDQQSLQGVKAGINFPIFFQNEVVGILGITGDPSTVTPFGEIVRKMTELIISENYYAGQFEWKSRAREAFVMDWLQSKDWDEHFLDRARVLNIDLTKQRICAIVELHDMEHPLPRDIWTSILDWHHFKKSDIVTRWGNNRIVLLLDSSRPLSRAEMNRKLKKLMEFITHTTKMTVYTGVGHAAEAHGFSHSYFHAGRAIKMASKNSPIIYDEDLKLEMLLDEMSPEVKKEFINRSIGPLLPETELLTTLKEYCLKNQSLKQTAANLHIHINTLHYRLKKIQELTGLDTAKTSDLTTLFLALMFLDE